MYTPCSFNDMSNNVEDLANETPRWVRDESGLQAWFSNDDEWMIRRGESYSDNRHGFSLWRRNHEYQGAAWALKWPTLYGQYRKLTEAKAGAEAAG